MANGTVKGSKDVFLHISALERVGLAHVDDGQKVTFDIELAVTAAKLAANLALVN